jgi:hypothetical protein
MSELESPLTPFVPAAHPQYMVDSLFTGVGEAEPTADPAANEDRL